jgi:DNA-binding transcriptional LysR family regulator
VSHSGLSKAMSVLQDELGFKLLSPRGRGLELTEKGKSIYEKSRQILEMVSSLMAQTTTHTSDLAGLNRSRFNVNLGPKVGGPKCQERDTRLKKSFST